MTPSRRNVLKSAGAFACIAASAGTSTAQSSGQPEIEQFQAEGVIPVSFVLAPQPPPLTPDLAAAIVAGALEIRQRLTFTPGTMILKGQIYITPPDAPMPLPADPPTTLPPTISLVNMAVERIWYGQKPKSLLLAGSVLSNPVVSPFGDTTGKLVAVSMAYDESSTPAKFIMMGLTVAGDHTVASPSGVGTLKFKTTPPPTPPAGGPKADAGVNFTTVQRQVTLDGTKSTGTGLKFSWTVIGKTASMGNANTATPIVQFVGGYGEYVFELTVTDSTGATSTARVTAFYLGR